MKREKRVYKKDVNSLYAHARGQDCQENQPPRARFGGFWRPLIARLKLCFFEAKHFGDDAFALGLFPLLLGKLEFDGGVYPPSLARWRAIDRIEPTTGDQGRYAFANLEQRQPPEIADVGGEVGRQQALLVAGEHVAGEPFELVAGFPQGVELVRVRDQKLLDEPGYVFGDLAPDEAFVRKLAEVQNDSEAPGITGEFANEGLEALRDAAGIFFEIEQIAA